MEVGHELIVITWLHHAKRDVLKGHPRNDPSRPLTGVFLPGRLKNLAYLRQSSFAA